ncbi:MAG: DUF2189 domain-containing protein [Rhodobacterales bacterium]|nr:DUF2189 domain-containing protein [Rhodobacterales bacterium]
MNQHEPAPQPANLFPFADRVNKVSVEDTFKWLAAGWRDFRASGLTSLTYGLFFVLAGIVLTVGLYRAGYEYLIAPMIEGFLLVGPALTVGLYAISRALEDGRKPHLGMAFTAWRANPVHLLALGLALVLFLFIWMRLAVMIFALSFPYVPLTLKDMVNAALFSLDGWVFLGIGTVVGCVMASLAFAMGAMALPMMLDRKVDFLQAVGTSFAAVVINARVMAVWAALVVVFTAAGLVSLYIGLAVTLPLIGHASWHAYKAVIKPPANP